MTNFPFFQHFVAKLIFTREVEIDEKLTDQIADLLIEKLKLNVVKQDKSHLVIHTWPENNAIHIDLMTCSPAVITSKNIKDCFLSFPINDVSVTQLRY